MKQKRFVPWFGANTLGGPLVGELLNPCKWVGIPFAGGMAEVPHVRAGQVVCNDLHRHVINLARCVRDTTLRQQLLDRLSATLFHPDELAAAQAGASNPVGDNPDLEAAVAYFITKWMGRSGRGGTDAELSSALPVRWNANGGGSNRRYRSAVESLDAWGDVFQRCEFTTLDVFRFLDRVNDTPDTGLYLDPPWPVAGRVYEHSVDDSVFHRRLRDRLACFMQARVVVRYGADPLIEELYRGWQRRVVSGRNAVNSQTTEWYFT